MKLKHILIVVALAVVIGGGFVVYKIIGSMDQIVEAAIEKFGSDILQAEVTLEGVEIDLSEGRVALIGLNIGNPDGFNTEYLFNADEIMLTMGEIGLKTDSNTKPIVIREILVQGPSVIYEMVSGGSNIDTVLRNIRGASGDDSTADEQGEGPKLIIEDLYVNNGQVNLSHSALGGKMMSSGLPDIHLQDIGKDKGGASAGEVADELMTALKGGATTAVAAIKGLPGAVSEQLKGLLGEDSMDRLRDAGDSVKDKLGETGEKIKGLFDK